MSKKEKNCLNCRIHWDRENRCEVCRWEDNDHPSLFYQITRSPEVLAEKFVFSRGERYWRRRRCETVCYEVWWSALTGEEYKSKVEAIAATATELKGGWDA